jgi:hypothetical protein
MPQNLIIGTKRLEGVVSDIEIDQKKVQENERLVKSLELAPSNFSVEVESRKILAFQRIQLVYPKVDISFLAMKNKFVYGQGNKAPELTLPQFGVFKTGYNRLDVGFNKTFTGKSLVFSYHNSFLSYGFNEINSPHKKIVSELAKATEFNTDKIEFSTSDSKVSITYRNLDKELVKKYNGQNFYLELNLVFTEEERKNISLLNQFVHIFLIPEITPENWNTRKILMPENYAILCHSEYDNSFHLVNGKTEPSKSSLSTKL